MQKCPPTQGEETFLAKSFKFFDIHNKGEVNFDQFHRAIEKMGGVIDKQVFFQSLFSNLTHDCVGLPEDF